MRCYQQNQARSRVDSNVGPAGASWRRSPILLAGTVTAVAMLAVLILGRVAHSGSYCTGFLNQWCGGPDNTPL
jgi:hypothetical protein